MSKPETLAAAAEMAKQNKLDRTAREIKQISKELKESIANAVLPEKVFVEYFLDYFKDREKYADTPLLSKWVELAGGPYREVDIIDDNRNVLYTAPGAMMAPMVDYENLNNIDFSRIASNYNMKKNITAVQGTNYLNGILSMVPNNIHTDVNKYINRWIAIFNRYDKPTKATTSKRVTKPDTDIFDI